MPQVNLGQIGSLFRNLPGSPQQITQAISRGFGSIPSATRQLAPGASRMQQGLPNAIIPGELSVRMNPVNFLPYPPRSPFPGEGIFKATRTGLTNLRNTAEAAIDTGRGVTNILGRAAGPSIGSIQQGVQGGLQRLEGALPTALNPFATRTPGSVLGKIGKAFNPLNPRNLKNSAAGAAVNLLPIGARNQATLQGAITLGGLTPLGVVGAIAANDMYNPLGLTDAQEAQNIVTSKSSMPKYWSQSQGGDSNIKNKDGSLRWAGRDYGFQSPESFNKLFGANLPTTPSRGTLNSSSAPGTQNSFTQNQAQSRTAPPAPTLPPPPGGPAAERSQRAEMSRIAQQTAQNPDFQRWQDQSTLARQSLQGYNPAAGPLPGAAQSAQDLGMKIWAQKYGPGSTNDLASKVRQGQSGFGVIQNTLANSAATAGLQMAGQLTPTPQVPSPTPFPAAPAQTGFPVPGAPTQEQLSRYPQFNPEDVDLNQFTKFIRGKFNK
jgi:hypothetical protein